MNTKEIMQKEDQYQLKTYSKLPIVIQKGEGMFVWDSEGKKYLDLYGGHAVALTGHCHPKVTGAIAKQAGKLIFYSNYCYSDTRAEAGELLISLAPKELSKVFFCNSGTEANETAMKIARRFTGKCEIIAMEASFHGRTVGSLSATGMSHYREAFSPEQPGFRFAKFGDIDSVKSKISSSTAAVILEPIQSMGGVRMAPPDFYVELRRLCDEKGIVLIFDEVQTGLGRTGYMFAGEGWGIQPDLISLAKGLAGGFPMGAVLVAQKIADTIGDGEHGSTFGGGTLACAALRANLEVIVEERLVDNALRMGVLIANAMKEFGFISEVRGRGLLLGLKPCNSGKELKDFLLAHNIITGSANNGEILRLLPPLTMKEEHLSILVCALREYAIAAEKKGDKK